jgi:hypothetical protein
MGRWQVAPAEIEAVLLKHPSIADAAVIGVTQKDASSQLQDEAVRAFVVRRQGLTASKLSADEVYRFSRRQLQSYKALSGGVIFVEDIPRTPSGKIQRFKLTQMNSYRELVSSLILKSIDDGKNDKTAPGPDNGCLGPSAINYVGGGSGALHIEMRSG